MHSQLFQINFAVDTLWNTRVIKIDLLLGDDVISTSKDSYDMHTD